MARLTEEMVIARSKQSDLSAIKKLNCWGAELGDVSLLRRMPNVEVLALSINKIRTLVDFAGCRRLRELYVRKNEIVSLAEIRHLRHLPALTSLWLDENPCTQHPEYRMTVLRNLPNLEKLDNVPVQPDEVQEATRRGAYIPDSDDEGYPPQQESYGQYRRQRSSESSPEREPDTAPYRQRHDPGSDSSDEPPLDVTRTEAQCPGACRVTSPEHERYELPALTRSHYESRPRSPDTSLRHSFSTHSVKEYGYSSNGECRYVTSPQHEYADRNERSEGFPSRECERGPPAPPPGPQGAPAGVPMGTPAGDREYPSAVMAEHRGFTRRPVARNSNLLSAVLCLVKELDYPSLEVAEMAVRCRMDELANSQ